MVVATRLPGVYLLVNAKPWKIARYVSGFEFGIEAHLLSHIEACQILVLQKTRVVTASRHRRTRLVVSWLSDLIYNVTTLTARTIQ